MLARPGLLFSPLQEAQHNCTACHYCIPLSVSQADPRAPAIILVPVGTAEPHYLYMQLGDAGLAEGRRPLQ